MSGLIDREAERLGMRTLLVNAAPDAAGFYERMGWGRFTWDATELTGHTADCVQMRKLLAP